MTAVDRWIEGTCPACRLNGVLYLSTTGHITCSWERCPDPAAAAKREETYMRCDAEMCPFWTGDGCACDVLDIDQEQREQARRDLGASS